MKISMIAAMTQNRVIGRHNDLPWSLPDDFAFFKKTTMGHCVIMGRKNFDSLPPKFKPLPSRANMVVTRNESFNHPGVEVFHSLGEALKKAKSIGEQEAFIIGGGEIYKLGLALADTIYLTEIVAEIPGDTFFPEFDKNTWRECSRVHHPADERHLYAFDFVIYEKL